MDNSVLSQRSISSISTSVQAIETHGGIGSTNSPSEFVNRGLFLWNQTRQRWVGKKKLSDSQRQPQEPKLSWNSTYESLLGSNKPFPQPISFCEMVDFLADYWLQEEMYD